MLSFWASIGSFLYTLNLLFYSLYFEKVKFHPTDNQTTMYLTETNKESAKANRKQCFSQGHAMAALKLTILFFWIITAFTHVFPVPFHVCLLPHRNFWDTQILNCQHLIWGCSPLLLVPPQNHPASFLPGRGPSLSTALPKMPPIPWLQWSLLLQ